jgi:hypothetical protein
VKQCLHHVRHLPMLKDVVFSVAHCEKMKSWPTPGVYSQGTPSASRRQMLLNGRAVYFLLNRLEQAHPLS